MTLDELERLLEKATPGPWVEPKYREGDDNGPYLATPSGKHIGRFDYADNNLADKRLIAALRNEAPKLIAAAREVERMREIVERVATYHPDKKLEADARAALKENT